MLDRGQYLLPFDAPERQACDNQPVGIFLAIRPDEGALDEIHKIATSLCKRRAGYDRPLGKARYHLTLHGPYPERERGRDVAAAVSGAVERVTSRGFAVCVDRLSNFGRKTGKHAVGLTTWSEMPGLIVLRDRVGEALRTAGLKPNGSFTPHVTLLHRHGLVGEIPLTPIRWQVRDFVLIRSFIGKSRHEEIGRWRLSD